MSLNLIRKIKEHRDRAKREDNKDFGGAISFLTTE